MKSPDTQRPETIGALEAILFAAGEPLALRDIKKICSRMWAELSEEERTARLEDLPTLLEELKLRWSVTDGERGFGIVEVAGGLTFRSNQHFSAALRAMREHRPVRLSRAALETLAIIAYRQPVTKPEIDDIRGVDCGGTIRLLLDRGMVRILGKREEPGRPLIYGTSKQFLSFFNLRSLNHLPTLREFNELSADAEEELRNFDGLTDLDDLKESAKAMCLDAEPSVEALDDAMQSLKSTEKSARIALAEQGIDIGPPKPDPTPEEVGVADRQTSDDRHNGAQPDGEPATAGGTSDRPKPL